VFFGIRQPPLFCLVEMPLWGSSSSFDRANADASLLSNGDGQVRLEEYPQKGKSSTVVDEHEVGGDTVSTWKVGWQTPTLMFSCYLIGMKFLLTLPIYLPNA
jgi:hypothetical protein